MTAGMVMVMMVIITNSKGLMITTESLTLMGLTVMSLTVVGLTVVGQTEGMVMVMVITEDPTLVEDIMTEGLAMVEDITVLILIMAMEYMLLMLGDTKIIMHL
jgi:hypothetical protein